MNEKIEAVLDSPWLVPAAIGVTSFASGLGLGYILGKRKTEDTFSHELPAQLELDFDVEVEVEEELIVETVETDDPVEEVIQPPPVVITEDVAAEKGIIKVNDLSSLRPSMIGVEEVEEEFPTIEELASDDDSETTVTIAGVNEDIEWDWEAELEKRTETAPYILHVEEFVQCEKNYGQSSLTYYSGDAILVDEDNVPIYNHSKVTGPLIFGHGSGDADVVFIRNDEMRHEYEICQLDALYSREILGLEIEDNARVADLKHSRNMRFRDVD